MTSMREAVARHMTYSKQNIPHYYLTMRSKVGAALDHRQSWNTGKPETEQVSINDLMIKAVALSLKNHPEFNGHYQDGKFTPQERINIGVAIALPDGLVAPAILDCQDLTISEIATRSKDLISRARDGKLRAEEYAAATFTITNLGMYHVDSFIAIIVPPQVGILAVGGVTETPELRSGVVAATRQIALTLSGDHRVTDGAQGAQLLGEIAACLTKPAILFA